MPQLMSGYEIRDGQVGEVLATRIYALSDPFGNEQYFNGSVLYKNVHNPVVDFILASTPDGFEVSILSITRLHHHLSAMLQSVVLSTFYCFIRAKTTNFGLYD
jgi:hypothetical protein